jgi:formyltetrahydrofolate synthetase
MAMLSIVRNLADWRERPQNITVVFDKHGVCNHSDSTLPGAMCAWMRNTINPTLCSTASTARLVRRAFREYRCRAVVRYWRPPRPEALDCT